MQNIKDYCLTKKDSIKAYVTKLRKKPRMAIIQVGNVEASNRYVRNKIKDAEDCGIKCQLIHFDSFITEEELLDEMTVLNNDPNIDGYLVQLPLPKDINEEKIKLEIKPTKDVDGFHPLAKTIPATPLGIYNYLKDQNFEFKGKNAVVIGRSNIVGKPMAKLLLAESMNVTVLHSKTSDEDKRYYIKNADLIIVATGHRNTLDDTFEFKPSCVIMDVGINFNDEGKLVGDVEQNLPVKYKSPVPGGCGLLTRLSVIENLITLYNNKRKKMR